MFVFLNAFWTRHLIQVYRPHQYNINIPLFFFFTEYAQHLSKKVCKSNTKMYETTEQYVIYIYQQPELTCVSPAGEPEKEKGKNLIKKGPNYSCCMVPREDASDPVGSYPPTVSLPIRVPISVQVSAEMPRSASEGPQGPVNSLWHPAHTWQECWKFVRKIGKMQTW